LYSYFFHLVDVVLKVPPPTQRTPNTKLEAVPRCVALALCDKIISRQESSNKANRTTSAFRTNSTNYICSSAFATYKSMLIVAVLGRSLFSITNSSLSQYFLYHIT